MSSPSSHGVIHLELHTGDGVGACSFLSELLGWPAAAVGPAERAYLALDMGERISGGVVECGTPYPQWVPYVVVEQVERATERADALGASVLLAPREGPAGWRSIVTSPASGAVALWQLKPEFGRPRRRRPA